MNLNPPEETAIPATPPTAMTRRQFIKRTASTAMVAIFALGAFECEARAEETAGSSGHFMLELTGWPEANITYTGTEGGMEVLFYDIEKTSTFNADGYTWKVQMLMRVNPNEIANELVPDDEEYHFLSPTSFGVSLKATVEVWQGATLIGRNIFQTSGSVGATLVDRMKGIVEGNATMESNASNTGTFHPNLGGVVYNLVLTPQALDGNRDPLGTSVSPTVGYFMGLWKPGGGPGGGDTSLGNASVTGTFTWASFHVDTP